MKRLLTMLALLGALILPAAASAAGQPPNASTTPRAVETSTIAPKPAGPTRSLKVWACPSTIRS